MSFWVLARKGFTLIEMAIVLVIVGLVISGGLLGIAPVIQGNNISQTNQTMDRIEQALTLYVIQNGCLPCPADAGTSTNPGTANGSTYYPSGCTTACTITTQGAVPWINLGLSEADITDAFGNRIDYAVTSPALTASNGMARTPPSGYPAGTLRVQTIAQFTSQPNCPTTTDCQTVAAAYVIISHGSDGSGAHATGTGTLRSDPYNSASQTANTDGTPFVQDQSSMISSTSHFDDVVRFRTAPIIIQNCGSNACGNPA